ncbi:glycoside hydrolase family 32 protein [Nonomuraea sp. SYSU D8015]|uniref:glycoside hydrolase family 32 protein n=1 Tax=Nonomuraea sp. SYSU D8015 TaxID=2593644 RepID=UPI001CB74AD6|nr:glycoside hydrolase family 32 protein [Nonomuraea sp. SYSU D8015]
MPPYSEPYRPQVHYTPARNWMNDPNGLVWHDGEFHLFYQYNPDGDRWGNISWGHAVSPDLVHWEELGTAIPATPDEQVFSGSVVVDEHDTAGFGKAAAVAVYTAWNPATGRQAQSLAYSTDHGRTWTRYAGNPVLDIGSTEFRDPKVFWHADGGYWVMVVALAADRKIALYSSDDLKAWTRLSEFGPAGATGGVWEVPDLFELPVEGGGGGSKWMMAVSLNPGGPVGGSGVQYFVGDFDGVTFTPDDVSTAWADHGRDFYAAVSWNGAPDGRRYWIGWMANWDDIASIGTRPWRGAMSLPRELSLVADGGRVRLAQRPVGAVTGLRTGPAVQLNDLQVSGPASLPVAAGCGAIEIIAEFEPGTAERFGFLIGGATSGHDAHSGDDQVGSAASRDDTHSGDDRAGSAISGDAAHSGDERADGVMIGGGARVGDSQGGGAASGEEAHIGQSQGGGAASGDDADATGGDCQVARFGYDVRAGELFVERGPGQAAAGRHGGPAPVEGGRVRFTAYLDTSSVELFGHGGQTVITDLVFPGPGGLGVFAEGGTAVLRSLTVQPLGSIWAPLH